MTRQPALHTRFAMLCLLVLLVTGACAPVFSDARLVGQGQIEITPNVSAAGVSDQGESEHLVNNFGVHALVGVHERADVGVGYMRTQAVNEGGGVNILEFGPKFRLVRDRAAFAVPMGFIFGENTDVSESWHFFPTVLFTVPAGERVDINPAMRVLIPICDGCELLLGFNLGAGIRLAQARAILRPEFGILINPGEDGIVWHFGMAVSIRPGAR